MRYAAVHRAWLDSEAVDAPVEALGAWVRLAVHAAELEDPCGDYPFCWGRIAGSEGWSDRAWMRAVGVTRAEVDLAVEHGLADWEPDGNLLVRGFDLAGLDAVRSRRQNGSKGGRPKASEKPTGNRTRTENKPLSSPLLSLPSQKDMSTSGAAKRGKPDTAPAVREVFDHWVVVMGKPPTAKLTADRRSKVVARLNEGYTVVDLKRAIDGCRHSTFHMGDNDRHQPFNDMNTILKSGKTVEEHMARVNGNGAAGRGPARAATLEELQAEERRQAEDPNRPEWAR